MIENIDDISVKQKIASNPDYSIWTSASAGSGKTTVLVKRLLRMLLSDIPVSKILCITFTNTGATEMKNRINKKLSEWTKLSNDDLKKEILDLVGDSVNLENNIKKARTLFAKILDNSEEFKILTIHSFCQNIIKRFPLEANIVPNFKIADELLADELLEKSKELLLKSNDDDIKKAIQLIFAYKNEDDFFELLKNIIKQKDNLLYLKSKFYTVDGVIDEISKILNISKNLTIKDIEEAFLNNTNFDIFTDDIKDFINSNGKVFDKKYLNFITNNKLLEESFLNDYVQLFLTEKGKITKRLLTAGISKEFPHINEFIESEALRAFNFQETKNNLINLEFTSAFLKITYYLFDIYDNLKREMGYLDYSDLIFETNKLLNDIKYKNLSGENFCSSWINYKLDAGIDHLLIDEAQDTSPIQWEIIRSITEEFFSGYGSKENTKRTIFVVGDEKQSIFSFQGAEPSNFNIMFNYYSQRIKDCGEELKNVYLNKSFRSLQAILNVTDIVFSEESRRNSISKSNAIVKHEIARLNDGMGKVEVWPLISVENDKNDSEDENFKKESNKATDWKLDFLDEIEETGEHKLAGIIASKISDWFKEKKVILDRKSKEERPLKYSDIMILVRRRNKNFINALIKQFNFHNIPTMGNDKFVLKDNIISKDIISLCKFALFNYDDLNLANIVKSPFLNMTEEDLYSLCGYKNKNNCTLWDSFKNDVKYKEKTIFLQDIINHSNTDNIYEFLFYIFDKLNMRNKIKERFSYLTDDVLNEFLNMAYEYEKSHNNATLLSFINFIEKSKLEIKRDLDQNSDEIKIITVHSAKGLESPIVFLPDTNHSSKTINKIDKILNYKMENLDYTIPLIQKEENKFFEDVKEYMKGEVEEEYLRLLYVAMTRAENELYVCDYERNQPAKENSWYSIIRNAIDKDERKKIITSDKYVKGEILYIGDDNKYLSKEFKSEKLENKDDNKVLEILNVLSAPSKKLNNIKIINPSLYYSENLNKSSTSISENLKNGKIVHKLLEILPNASKTDRESIINAYLINESNKDKIKEIVLNILNNKDFDFIFGENSKAEVPVFGKIGDKIISGQIDRLAIVRDKVYIIDYKNSNILPNKIPERYVKQLELYRDLLSKIYLDKNIECYIIWTGFGTIQKI